MPSKIFNNAVELNKINFDSTNNKINFTVAITNNGSPIADATAGSYANSAFLQANAAFQSANNVAPQVQPAFDKANAAFNAANSVNVYDANTTSTGFFSLPKGNTAQRPTSPLFGSSRYNTDINGLEVYTSNGWQPLAAPPTISTVTPATFSGESGTEFTINGTNFTSDATVYFITSNGTSMLASSVTFYSSSQLKATTPRNITVQEEPISVRVTQQSGTVIKSDCIDAGGLPTWITTAGALGSVFGVNTVNVYVTATDPEGTAVSYQLSSGSLPGGLQLSANGLIQGLANSVLANTTYNFVIKANDTVNNNTDRSFSYTILNRAPVINTASGLLATFYSGNAVPSTTISAYDPDGGQLTFTAPTGNIVNTTIGSANGTIVGTPIVVTTNTTYTIGITATDEGSCTASNTYTFTVLNRPPVWNTAATLPSANADYTNTITINAYDPDGGSVTYALTSGSLPTGMSLVSANGTIVGAPPDVESNTTSSFTVTATDIGNDANARTFSLTITPSPPDANISSTVLLLRGNAGNTVLKDASSNNLNIIPYGDAKSSNFSPYNSTWSNLFSSGYLRTTSSTALGFSTNAFTIEAWVYMTNRSADYWIVGGTGISWQCYINTSGYLVGSIPGVLSLTASTIAVPLNKWTHIAYVRTNTGTNGFAYYVDGVQAGTQTFSNDLGTASATVEVGLTNGGAGVTSFTGYISNLRVVKGTAVYSGNFTPSTSSLTAISGTSLLTCQSNRFVDNSSSNSNFTISNVKVVGGSPFTETDTANGSMYFDGTGDYLSIDQTTATSLGSNNFTLEFWIYFNAATTNSYNITGKWNSGSEWILQWRAAGVDSIANQHWRFYTNNGSGPSTDFTESSTTAVAPYTWHHIALVRNGSSFNLYRNGVQIGSTLTSSASITETSDTLQIGAAQNAFTPLNGYLSDYRLVVGTAVYTSAFTPPTAPLTAVANTKLLTLQTRRPHNNKSFQDKSTNKFLFTSYNEITQSAFSPYNPFGWSNYFNTSSYLRTSVSALSSSSFTVEAWIFYTGSNSADRTLFDFSGGTGGYGMFMEHSSAGQIRINLYSTNSVGSFFGSVSTSFSGYYNKWIHVAATYDGSTYRLFINGNSVGTPLVTGTQVTSINQLSIGARSDSTVTQGWSGYISNFRYVTGAALYTGSFTPSTSSLGIAGSGVTRLLTCQSNRFIDNSSSPYTLSTLGTPTVQAFSPFSPVAAYSPSSNSGSIFCDGSNDYLFNSDPIFNPNYSFTTEGWFYLTSTPGVSSAWIIGQNNNAQYIWTINSSLAVAWSSFNYPSAGSQYSGSTASNAIKVGCWNHLAVVRNGNAWNIYVNGTSANSMASLAAVFGYPTDNSLFMNNRINDYGSFPGFISDLRFSQEAIYTGNFTPPTTPLQATSNTRLLLTGTDAAIFDSVGKHAINTISSVKANNTLYKFANSSIYFNGSSDYLTIPSNDLLLIGTGDFTIEFWANRQSSWSTSSNFTDGGSNALDLYTSGGNLRIAPQNAGGSTICSLSGLTQNTWIHIAVVRSSGVTTGYINGANTGAVADTNNYSAPITRIGGYGDGYYNGHLADFRISRGARYTTNFTPPTRSYPNR